MYGRSGGDQGGQPASVFHRDVGVRGKLRRWTYPGQDEKYTCSKLSAGGTICEEAGFPCE